MECGGNADGKERGGGGKELADGREVKRVIRGIEVERRGAGRGREGACNVYL